MSITKEEITAQFRKKYHSFTYFLDEEFSGLCGACFEAATDAEFLSHVKFCNDVYQIPPVRTFLVCNKGKVISATGGKILSDKEKRGIGAFWGTVFKCSLGYKESKNSIFPKNDFGVTTASYFA